MTNTEMKTVLANTGVSTAEIEKVTECFDVEKITEIVEAANSPREAFENLHTFYPELAVESLEEQMDFVQGQFEAALKAHHEIEAVELTEDELEMVSGGGFFSWIKDNWKKVAVGVGVAAVFAVVGAASGGALAGVLTGVICIGGYGFTAGFAMGAAAGAILGGITGLIGGIPAGMGVAEKF